jgi:hypothetical protein
MAEQQSAKKKVRNKATEALLECFQGITRYDTDLFTTEDFLIQHNEYEEEFRFMKGRVYPKAISIRIPRAEGAPAAYPETFPLETLNQRQLSKLSSLFGLRNASKMKKEVILISLGGLSKIGSVLTALPNKSPPPLKAKQDATILLFAWLMLFSVRL